MFKTGRILLINIISFFCSTAFAMPALNLPTAVTPLGKDIYWLHMTIFYICCIIFAIVAAVLIYALIKHRKSTGHKAAEFHEHTTLEIVWAVIPFIILIVMAIPATQVLMRMNDTAEADVNIKVTGYQWKWKYEYLDNGISFYSNIATPQNQIQNKAPKGEWYLLEVDKPVVVPIHKKIRFLVTSNDVIHSWWIPALGIKRDAMPGFIYETWARIEKPGIYRGQCAELCGLNHGFMPIVVEAVSEEDYQKWLVQNAPAGTVSGKVSAVVTPPAKLSKTVLMQRGENAYGQYCAACHQADGKGMPPAFPALAGSKIATGPVAAHINIVLNGKHGTAMQAFADQLKDEDIAAIITYERNAWGNDKAPGKYAGGLVQAADIAAARRSS